ncbi:LysR family transcriptional regulator [Pseudoduganella albidiflava]|uniref:LysR family transcriptional regulator n=1 Tax=Pseudoduganella albidiflava TaxID=321983 RepID=A0A411X034_9BURK|nr:LysR family transcriptional regulator [Pseudoduganella albidiflava]QBI02311.1 LysR family transcriptional regulator [Pseudoduganella albidiflava]GGY67078.1 LysR family transcriptional regulator [Pseudoduganella albidiflava]
MELRRLRYFVAVAEEGNVTRAAERLGIGQPPLSQQILTLERELDVPLFHRTGHGMSLTEAGKALMVDAKRLLNDAQSAVANAQRAGRGETGHVHLGLTASAAFHPIVRALIRAFRATYPGVALTLTEGTTTQLLALLEEGRLDLALMRPGTHSFAGIALYQIASEPMKVVLPAGHRLAKSRRIPLTALAGEAFVLIPREESPMLHDEILNACRLAGFEPVPGQQAPQLSSVVNLVSAEFGVSIVPASVSQIRAEGVVYVDIADVKVVTNLALASRDAEPSAKVANFLALADQARSAASAGAGSHAGKRRGKASNGGPA